MSPVLSCSGWGVERVLSIQTPTPQFLGERFLRLLGPGVADDSLSCSPAKTGLVLRTLHDHLEGQRLAALQLRRWSKRETQPIGIDDLTEMSIRGPREVSELRCRPPGDASRTRTAYHEAGHACMVVVASEGANIPDYASIVPAKKFDGIVRDSLSFHGAQDDFTSENLFLRVRILLSGRAGQEICFGPRQISSGATSDLASATRMIFRHFAHSGFHSGMENGHDSGAFLAVFPRDAKPDPLQASRVHREVRRFLAGQYAYAIDNLQEHRPFVDAVAERFLWDPLIDQSEMTGLAREFGLLQ
jgi:ATP-dependent Zn protease